jgi:endonuclease V-like protein UPF0215 family
MTVGVVARGGLYLDGVISFPPNLKDPSRESTRRIIDSVYFSELRAVMLHNRNYERESDSVERTTGLPIITVSKDEPLHGRGFKAFRGKPGRLWVRTRVQSTVLKKILTASWTMGRLPEPLRVAHLLAKLDFSEISG